MKLSGIPRFSSTLESIFASCKDIRKLINLYLSTKLTPTELSTLIKSIDNLSSDPNTQSNFLFNTVEGRKMLKDLIGNAHSLPIADQLNILSILSKTKGKNKSYIITKDLEKNLCLKFSTQTNPDNDLPEFIRAFKIAASLENLNVNFMNKLRDFLSNNGTISNSHCFEILAAVIQFPYYQPRKIAETVLSKIAENGINSIENDRLLSTAFLIFSELDAKFHLAHDWIPNLKEPIMRNISTFDSETILNILDCYSKNLILNPEYFELFFKYLVKRIEERKFLVSDLIERLAKIINQFHLNHPHYKLGNENLLIVTKSTFILSECNKIRDNEFISVLNTLRMININLLKLFKNKIIGSLNKNSADIYNRLLFSILLSPIDEEMKQKAINGCKKHTILGNLSMKTYLNLYSLIITTNLNQSLNFNEGFLNFIEAEFKRRVYNFTTYRDVKSMLSENKMLLSSTKLWTSAIKHVISLFKLLLVQGHITNLYLLNQTRILYTYPNNLDDEWSSLMAQCKFTSKEVTLAIVPYYEEDLVEAMLFILTNQKINHGLGLTHCLGLRKAEPKFRELVRACELLKRKSLEVLLGGFFITQDCLFESLYFKGFSPELKEVFMNLDYLNLRESIEFETWIKFVSLNFQYGLITKSEAVAIMSIINAENIKNDEIFIPCSFALDVIPEGFDVFQYFDLNFNLDSREFLKKINFWIHFSHNEEENKRFYDGIKTFVGAHLNDKQFLVRIVEGLTVDPEKNQEFYKEVLELFVEEVLRFTEEATNPSSSSTEISNNLSRILISLIQKSYNNETNLLKLESMINPSEITEDILCHLIKTYQKIKRNSKLLSLVYTESINKLNDSTFYSLSLNRFKT